MKSTFSILALGTLVLLSYGLYQALIVAPREMTMGDAQRIFYYHVPSAWTSFLCFFANLVASIWYLASRNPKADAVALTTAEVGVVFCTVVLVTGPIWAKPIWGIWWTWDARLTSTLVLWLIYVSYLLLRRYSTAGQNPVLASVLAVFGAVDVVFVYMAIRWFRTQHPQPVIGGGQGSGIDPRMMHALLINWYGFLALAFLVIWLRYRLERLRQQVEEAHAMKAIAGAKGASR
ncbi:MAG: cytochrome c biogenesis protein CcsA [Acidobacteriia bacterium]|nr:cytochrome c biogenesis protein CcsA [Terriglobia bacterium]